MLGFRKIDPTATADPMEWDFRRKRLNRSHKVLSFIFTSVYAGASWFIFSGFMQLTTELSKSLGTEMPVPGEILLAVVAVILILMGGIFMTFMIDGVYMKQRVKLGERP